MDRVSKVAIVMSIMIAVSLVSVLAVQYPNSGLIGLLQQPLENPQLKGGLVTSFTIDCHVWHYDSYGNLISYSHHAMTVVDNGKDWTEQQLFNPNASQKALWIGVSNDSSSVSTAWTSIPNEITDGGLLRAVGSYVSTGVGTANVTYTFSVTDTRSTKLYGLYYGAYATDPATLIAAEQQGVGNQKNLSNGDTLKVTIQWSHS